MSVKTNRIGMFILGLSFIVGAFISVMPNAKALTVNGDAVSYQDNCDFYDDFEDDPVFLPPTSCWYTISGGSGVSTVARSMSPTHSMGVSSLQYTFNELDMCEDNQPNAQAIHWSFNVDDLATTHTANFGSTSGSNSLYVQIAPTTGTVVLGVRPNSASTTTTTLTGLTIVPDQWYNATLSMHCLESGSNAAVNMVARITDTVSGITYGASRSQGSGAGMSESSINFETFTVGDATSFIDDLYATGYIALNAADATYTSANAIHGFAHLLNGEAVAINTGLTNDDTIVLSGETLTLRDSRSTGCQGSTYGDTVAAIGDEGFSYLQCPGSNADVESILFMDNFANDYPFNCGAGDDCNFDGQVLFDSITVESDFTSMRSLYNGQVITHITDSDTDIVQFYYGIGASITGNVHGLIITMKNVNDVLTEFDVVETLTYGAAGDPEHICATRDSTESEAPRFYAVDNGVATKGYSLEFNGAQYSVPAQNHDLNLVFTGPPAINQVDDVACSENLLAVADTSGTQEVVVYNLTTASVLYSILVSNVADVALSFDNNWLSYSIAGAIDTTYVVDLSTGNITCQLQHSQVSQGVVDTGIDQFGQRLWVVQDTTVNYYSVQEHGCTTEEPITSSGGTSTTTTTSGTSTTGGGGFGGGGADTCGDNFFGLNIPLLADNFGIQEEAMRWMVGLLVLSLIVGVFMAGGVIIGAVGVIVAVSINIAFCLFPVWLLLVLVFLIVVMLGNLVFGGNGD